MDFRAARPDSDRSVSATSRMRVTRRGAWRWLLPAGVVGVVAVLASGVLNADANPNLPPESAARLLASVGDAKLATFSGTVVSKASLGLPELPQLSGGQASTGMLGLLTGSHTARVWYGGETKQRVALLSSLGEQDVFRNGRDLWQWNSDDRTATHTLLGSDVASAPAVTHTVTPDVAAQRALELIGPSTDVSTDHTGSVAGRSTYTLVLAPKDTRSRVGSVRISVDGKSKLPLGVQVYARGSDRPALDIAYTRIDFSTPSDDFFTFRPPAGVVPKENPSPPAGSGSTGSGSEIGGQRAGAPLGTDGVRTTGSDWTTVVEVTGDPTATEPSSSGGSTSGELNSVLAALPRVSGTWGSGRLFSSALLSALLTDDGRMYVGAVDPDLLYQAAAAK